MIVATKSWVTLFRVTDAGHNDHIQLSWTSVVELSTYTKAFDSHSQSQVQWFHSSVVGQSVVVDSEGNEVAAEECVIIGNYVICSVTYKLHLAQKPFGAGLQKKKD